MLLEQYKPSGCPINRQDYACYMTMRVHPHTGETHSQLHN